MKSAKPVLILLIILSVAAFCWLRLERTPDSQIDASEAAKSGLQGEASTAAPPTPPSAPSPRSEPKARLSTSSPGPVVNVAAVKASLPPELDALPDSLGGESFDPAEPLAPMLDALQAQAESDPLSAVRLAWTLGQCARVERTSVEQIVSEWRQEWALMRERLPEAPDALIAERINNQTQNARHELLNLRKCAGVADPASLHIRWLERAARVHPDPLQRDRLQIDYIKEAFADMPLASDRIARIDEAMRRRDVAAAWLIEQRDKGNVRAIDLYVVERSRGGALLPPDPIEASAWYFVYRVRSEYESEASQWYRPRPGAPTAADLWRLGAESTGRVPLSDADLREADVRGRDIYLRLFGSPPA